MKKRLLRIVISFGILIGFLLILSLIYLFKFQNETRLMTPLPNGKVIAGIYAVNNGFVNLYLIQQDRQLIAIDAGMDMKATKNEMNKLNFDPEKVDAVFLTHTDSDHVAAVDIFKNAKVFISKKEEQMVNGKTHRQLIFNNTLPQKHQLLSDNEVINLSKIKIQAISTPGHTPGSMSYLVNERYLFTGDLLSLKNGKVEVFNRFFNMDTKTEKKSIHKIKSYSNIKYIITAHYGYTEDPVNALKAW